MEIQEIDGERFLYVFEFFGECPDPMEEHFSEGGCGAVFSEEEVIQALREYYYARRPPRGGLP